MLHCRKLLFSILIASLAIGYHAFAQENLTYRGIDSVTYRQYLDGDYVQLQQLANKAFDVTIDFYDLRMRVAIACYNQQNYEAALPHFLRAYQMNPADTIVQEYVYYTYLFSARSEDAAAFAENTSDIFREKIGYKKKWIDYVGWSNIAGLAGNTSIDNQTNLKGANNIYGETTLNQTIFGTTAYFQNSFTNRLHIINGISLFNTHSEQIIQTANSSKSTSFSDIHYQYNLATLYQFQQGWSLGAAFVYYNNNPSSFSWTATTNTFLPSVTNSSDSHATIITLGKRFPYIQMVVSEAMSNLSSAKQYQTETQLIYYPLGNLNLYTVSSVAYIDNGGTEQWVLMQKIAKKIADYLYCDMSFSYGNHTNYITSSGFITYNTAAKIQWIGGLNCDFFFNKFTLSLGYSIDKREFQSWQYSLASQNTSASTQTYFNNAIKTNIKWNF